MPRVPVSCRMDGRDVHAIARRAICDSPATHCGNLVCNTHVPHPRANCHIHARDGTSVPPVICPCHRVSTTTRLHMVPPGQVNGCSQFHACASRKDDPNEHTRAAVCDGSTNYTRTVLRPYQHVAVSPATPPTRGLARAQHSRVHGFTGHSCSAGATRPICDTPHHASVTGEFGRLSRCTPRMQPWRNLGIFQARSIP